MRGTHQHGEAALTWVEGWWLQEYDLVDSTNLVAASLGVWNAVRANRQTAGRGRFQRSWISDAGGLWLSGVAPIDLRAPDSRAFPLAVGLAVCDALRGLGVKELRMRWPNDVLVEDRKLAGLLIDQFRPGLAVAGIGINVGNEPETRDASLKNQTTRLADLLPSPPSLPELTALILLGVRQAAEALLAGEMSRLLPRVNQLWDRSRLVELDLDGELRRGRFNGVDETGRLLLVDESGATTAFNPWQVRHLQEKSD
jgi:BirA family biotin operon repressor/biotin-[acetyl-CoA-carboxylase] ligase